MTKPLGVGDALVESGDLTVRRFGRASNWRKQHGGTIERALLATGAVSEEVLSSALSRTYDLPAATRDDLTGADPDLVDALPAKERRRLRALPFRHEGNLLDVAVSDPRNVLLAQVLGEATGFKVKIYVTPDPVLEDLIDWFEKGAPPPPPPRLGPAAEVTPPEAPGAEPAVSPDAVEKLGRAVVAEALRFSASEMTLGVDTRGGFVRTFHSDHPALTQRLSAALPGPLIRWFENRCHREGGFVVEFAVQGEPSHRRRIELLGSSLEEARLRFVELPPAATR